MVLFSQHKNRTDSAGDGQSTRNRRSDIDRWREQIGVVSHWWTQIGEINDRLVHGSKSVNPVAGIDRQNLVDLIERERLP